MDDFASPPKWLVAFMEATAPYVPLVAMGVVCVLAVMVVVLS